MLVFKNILVPSLVLGFACSACDFADIKGGIPPLKEGASRGLPVVIDGGGSRSIGAIQVVDSVGTIQIQGSKYPTYLYYSIPWPEIQRTLYQGIAADNSHLYLYWVYCKYDGTIDSIYWEGTNGPALTPEQGFGACGNTQGTAPAQALDFSGMNVSALTPHELVTGFEITGNAFNYSPQSPGLLARNALTLNDPAEGFRVYPFGSVDCSSCGTPGWYELHTLFVNEAASRVCIGIVYLRAAEHPLIQYSLCLPDLSAPLDLGIPTSEWSRI